MKKFKVMIDYKNFIPIGEHELEKAMRAFVGGNGAVFEEGATARIEAILPDYHAMMGWNYGYALQPEDWAMIGTDNKCNEAKLAISKTRDLIAGIERPSEISAGVKKVAAGMSVNRVISPQETAGIAEDVAQEERARK